MIAMTNKDIPTVTINGHKVKLKHKPFDSPNGTVIAADYYLGNLSVTDANGTTDYHLGLLVSGIELIKDKTK